LPSIVLALILVACFFAVKVGPRGAPEKGKPVEKPALGPVLAGLFRRPQFLVTLALSFVLTLMRESFNAWSVDFLASIQGGAAAVQKAGWQSTLFDIAGGVSIVAFGVAYDRVSPGRRRWLMASSLGLLALVVAALPPVAAASPAGAAILVGA